MKQTADELFRDNYHWSCLAAGKDQMAAITTAALLGGHVRVGLEDSLWLGRVSWQNPMLIRLEKYTGYWRNCPWR